MKSQGIPKGFSTKENRKGFMDDEILGKAEYVNPSVQLNHGLVCEERVGSMAGVRNDVNENIEKNFGGIKRRISVG